MSHIFISYARKNDKVPTDKIADVLVSKGLGVWLDRRNLLAGVDFEAQIIDAVREADVFLFLFSKNSVDADGCKKEIQLAVEHNKRIIVVRIDQVSEKRLSPLVSRKHFIDCREGEDDFDTAIIQILDSIYKDYEWLKYHRELENEAIKWKQNDEDDSYLLRKSELQEAEQKLASSGSNKDPLPTDLQREFVGKSRKVEDEELKRLAEEKEKTKRRLRSLALGVGGVGVVAVIAIILTMLLTGQLGIYSIRTGFADATARAAATQAKEQADARATAQANAELQQNRADQETRTSLAGHLAKLADTLRRDDPALSFLLSVEAYKLDSNLQTQGVLYDNVQAYPQISHVYSGASGGGIHDIAFSPDWEILAITSSGLDGGQLLLFDTGTGEQKRVIQGKDNQMVSASFSSDGQIVASGNFDGTVFLFDPTSGKPIRTLNGHTDLVDVLEFSPDGQMLASGSYDRKVMLWDITTWEPVCSFELVNPPDSIAFSPNEKIFATSDGWSIRFWDYSCNALQIPLESHYGSPSGVLFNHNGRFIAFYNQFNERRNIIIQDVSTGQTITNLTLNERVWGMAFNANWDTLAYGSQDGQITLWDLNSGTIHTKLVGPTRSIFELVFSPNGNVLASRSFNGNVIFWNLDIEQSGDTISRNTLVFRTPSGFSPDGKIVLIFPGDSSIILEDTSRGSRIGQPLVHATNDLDKTAFSPDSRLLATAGEDGTITLWDIAKTEPVFQLPNPGIQINSLAFSSDGNILAARDRDNKDHLWNINPEEWISDICNRAGRNLTQMEWQQYFPNQLYHITCPQWPVGE